MPTLRTSNATTPPRSLVASNSPLPPTSPSKLPRLLRDCNWSCSFVSCRAELRNYLITLLHQRSFRSHSFQLSGNCVDPEDSDLFAIFLRVYSVVLDEPKQRRPHSVQ